jgi:adenine specific DNA methylase Mod
MLLKQFMRDDGVIFVSIEENEYGSLRLLLDELFGVRNRIGTIIWKNVTDNNPTNIAVEHE